MLIFRLNSGKYLCTLDHPEFPENFPNIIFSLHFKSSGFEYLDNRHYIVHTGYYSGMCRRVALERIDVSEESVVSIIRVKESAS
jgi:hypothetical protein